MAATPAHLRGRFGAPKPVRIEPHALMNPLVSIWLEPRATLRFILSTDKGFFVHTLAILAAITATLSHMAVNGLGEMLSLPSILLFAICSSMVLGLVQLYLLSGLVSFSGRFFGGRGGFGEVRAALAWGSLPMVASLLVVWTPALLIFGHEIFAAEQVTISESPVHLLLFMIGALVHIGLVCWSIYLTVATVAEAHQVTLMRGGFTLGAAWLMFLAFVGVAVLVGMGVMLMMGEVEAAEEARRAAEPLPAPLYMQ